MNSFVEELWLFIVSLSLGATIPVSGLLLVLRLFSGKVSARVEYRLQSFALFLFVCPVYLMLGSVFYKFQWISVPVSTTSVIFSDVQKELVSETISFANNETAIGWSLIGGIVWFVVLCILVSIALFSWFQFQRKIKDSDTFITEIQENIFLECKSQQGISKNISLKQSEAVTSPMLMGLFHPMVILPTKPVDEALLPSIFTHELVHYSRRDLWRKSLMSLICIIHWFNPLVHYLGKELERAMEFSCDERVLELLGNGERKNYSYAILNYTQKSTILCGLTLNGKKNTKKNLKTRLAYMLSDTPKTPKTLTLLVGCSLILGLSIPAYAYCQKQQEESMFEEIKQKLEGLQQAIQVQPFAPTLSQNSKNISVRPWNGTDPLELEEGILSIYENEALFPSTDWMIEDSLRLFGEFYTPIYQLASLSLEDEGLFPPESWEIILQRAENNEILLFDTNAEQEAYHKNQ